MAHRVVGGIDQLALERRAAPVAETMRAFAVLPAAREFLGERRSPSLSGRHRGTRPQPQQELLLGLVRRHHGEVAKLMSIAAVAAGLGLVRALWDAAENRLCARQVALRQRHLRVAASGPTASPARA